MSGSLREKFLFYQKEYSKFFPAAFFVAGFLFDIITLSRIDDWLSIAQQGIYLFVLITILKYKTLQEGGVWTPSEKAKRWWVYNNEALHFILGSLLSAYTLFYFVSASLSTSFIYMIFLFGLLVVNELPSVQAQGLRLKFALFSICLYSYFFIIVPISLGFIGIVPFLVSVGMGVGFFILYYRSQAKLPFINLDIKKTVLYPPLLIAIILSCLYVLKLLPPIPLSVQYIGIYHQIEKNKVSKPNGETETQFVLKYDRPFWKFWQNGAQTFVAEPQDKIHCFVRVFAPANFEDKVVFHWLKKERRGWMSQDKIPNQISGGRDAGFRGIAVKSNFDPGEWRVQLETTDGREIARIGFTVEKSATQNLVRAYRTDVF